LVNFILKLIVKKKKKTIENRKKEAKDVMELMNTQDKGNYME